MSSIVRRRGDTRRIRKTVKIDGVVVDITGWSFLLTVNKESEPTDTTNQVMQLIGIIVDGPNGIVDFFPAASDVDWVDTYYYDIEATDDGGGISTPEKGDFTLLQDITKPMVYLWTPEDGDDGSAVPLDGTGALHLTTASANDAATLQTRDTVPVVRFSLDYADTTWKRGLRFLNWPRLSTTKSWRITLKAYIGDDSFLLMSLSTWLFGKALWYIENKAAEKGIRIYFDWTAPLYDGFDVSAFGKAFTSPGWVEARLEYFGATGVTRARIWQPPATEPDIWDIDETGALFDAWDQFDHHLQMSPQAGPTSVIDLAYVKIEELS